MPKISVIVPIYKVEQYLPACVESVLAQTVSDFELILVDDGSPDGSGAICDAYAQRDSRIRVIHQENGGLSAARNAGMDIARGDYLTFVDSDDLVSADYLMALLNAAREQDAEIAVCRFCRFTTGTPDTRSASVPEPVTAISPRDAVCMLYRGDERNPINACAKLFHSSVIGSMRFPKGRLHEDQAFVPRVCYRALRIALVPARLYYYRDREDSITSKQFSVKRYDDIWAIDQCIQFFEAHGEEKILSVAGEKRKRLLCSYAILAKAEDVCVPAEYRIPAGKALRYLRKHVSDEKYTYFLSKLHPRLVLPHTYFKKLSQIFSRDASAEKKDKAQL